MHLDVPVHLGGPWREAVPWRVEVAAHEKQPRARQNARAKRPPMPSGVAAPPARISSSMSTALRPGDASSLSASSVLSILSVEMWPSAVLALVSSWAVGSGACWACAAVSPSAHASAAAKRPFECGFSSAHLSVAWSFQRIVSFGLDVPNDGRFQIIDRVALTHKKKRLNGPVHDLHEIR